MVKYSLADSALANSLKCLDVSDKPSTQTLSEANISTSSVFIPDVFDCALINIVF